MPAPNKTALSMTLPAWATLQIGNDTCSMWSLKRYGIFTPITLSVKRYSNPLLGADLFWCMTPLVLTNGCSLEGLCPTTQTFRTYLIWHWSTVSTIQNSYTLCANNTVGIFNQSLLHYTIKSCIIKTDSARI